MLPKSDDEVRLAFDKALCPDCKAPELETPDGPAQIILQQIMAGSVLEEYSDRQLVKLFNTYRMDGSGIADVIRDQMCDRLDPGWEDRKSEIGGRVETDKEDTETQDTIWRTGDKCPNCGGPIATNGNEKWCENGCDDDLAFIG